MKYKIENIEITEDQLNELIKQRDEVKNGRFRPDNGQRYFFVDGYGCVVSTPYDGVDFDKWKVIQGNCFRTEEEARSHKQYLIAKAEVNSAIEEVNEGWKPDWRGFGQLKYRLHYSHSVDKWDCEGFYTTHCISAIHHINSLIDAEVIIETQKENLDIIRKYHD